MEPTSVNIDKMVAEGTSGSERGDHALAEPEEYSKTSIDQVAAHRLSGHRHSTQLDDFEILKKSKIISNGVLDVVQSISDSLDRVESWGGVGNPIVVKTRAVLPRMKSYIDPNTAASTVTYKNLAADLGALDLALTKLLDKAETVMPGRRKSALNFLYSKLFVVQSPPDIIKALTHAVNNLRIIQSLAVSLEQNLRFRAVLLDEIDHKYPLPPRYGSIGRRSPINPPASKELIQRVKETIDRIGQRFDLFNELTISDSNLERRAYFREQRLDGTCDWFVHNQEFQNEWLLGGHKGCSTLVCWGRPGVGKSVIASRVIDALSSLKRPHAYYFLGNCGVTSAERLTASLLSQLHGLELDHRNPDVGSGSSSYDDSISSLMRDDSVEVITESQALPTEDNYNMNTLKDCRTPSGSSPAIDTLDGGFADEPLGPPTSSTPTFASPHRPFSILLKELVDTLSGIHDEVFIVLDAWEEERMEPGRIDDFRAVLTKLHVAGCKLFLTTRTEPRDMVPFTHELVSVENKHNSEDIERFIRSRMQDAGTIPRLPLMDSKTMDSFCQEAVRRSQGSFTLATLLCNNFRITHESSLLCLSPSGSRSSIEPVSAHISCLSRLKAPVSIYITSTLLWLAFAITPVPFDSFWEPLQWVSSRLQAYQHDQSDQKHGDRKINAILDQLEGLVRIDRGNRLMQLSPEVGEITKSMCFSEEQSTAFTSSLSGKEILGYICLWCIEYLLAIPMEYTRVKSKTEANRLLQEHPLLSHVVRNWATYCREFDARVMGGQTREKISGQPFKGKGVELHNIEATHDEVTKEEALHNVQAGSEEGGIEEEPTEESGNQLKAFASLRSKVSARTSELIEDNAKMSMVILLATYLGPDSSTLGSNWQKLLSQVTSMSGLAIASRLGLNREVQRILDRDRDQIYAQDSQGDTPLHEAARAGFEDVVYTLLDAGAPVSAINQLGMSPGEYAKYYTRPEIFVIIFDRMCILDSSLLDETNEVTAYYYSCVAESQKDLKRSRDLVLCHVVKIPNVVMTQGLLENGADPNAFDDEGIPVLHHAIRHSTRAVNRREDRRCPDFLLHHGADPTIKSKGENNESALHVAIRHGNLPIFQLLLIYGADPSDTDSDGRPPMFALFGSKANYSEESYRSLLSGLVGRGAELDQPDNKGRRALHLAAQHQLPYVTQKLIWLGADCNYEDEDRKIPLEYAQDTKNENGGILKVLTYYHCMKENVKSSDDVLVYLLRGDFEKAYDNLFQALQDRKSEFEADDARGGRAGALLFDLGNITYRAVIQTTGEAIREAVC
ncbi:hypothetical protein O1611_g512 [Lasiodiplodia mahajangana]|uniref:Uncharacterized protein n=1 Tax=Lasiodiplodia mahajangana TaxID=1108764 RepID=A0ACC2K0E0_9PEZI|nr:hypothetical protein O1611_g512 [Lasiodiplodia mahajangana]